MPKKLSDTEKLAIWFTKEILGEGFDYRLGNHRYQLKIAKELVNPDPDRITGEVPVAYAMDEIKEYIIALRDGSSDVTDYLPFEDWARRNGFKPPWTIRSLRILTTEARSKGKSFLALLSIVPEPPPVFDGDGFAEWVREHGERGLKHGAWDGLFQWWPDETPGTCERMSLAELEGIVGAELARKSLEMWYEAQKVSPPRSQK